MFLAGQIQTLDPGEWVGATAMINLVTLLIVAAVVAGIASGGRGVLRLRDEV